VLIVLVGILVVLVIVLLVVLALIAAARRRDRGAGQGGSGRDGEGGLGGGYPGHAGGGSGGGPAGGLPTGTPPGSPDGHRKLADGAMNKAMGLMRGALPAEAVAQIDQAVREDKKILAIKLLREHSSLDLKQANAAIEFWDPYATGGVAPVGTGAGDGVMATLAGASGAGSADLLDLVRNRRHDDVRTLLGDGAYATIEQALRENKQILAIKELRNATGLGLKESKTVIENWDPVG
jgi:ribosomal protein L7/L12